MIVGLLIAFEFAMAAAFLVNDRLLDSDSLTEFIDLGEEQSLPTWFSSIQWFCTAVLMWAFVERNVRWANSTVVAAPRDPARVPGPLPR